MKKRRVLILGAAGRDFHNFNMYYRHRKDHEVIAFTAAQIPDITDRRYPPELAGEFYPEGIPIYRADATNPAPRGTDHPLPGGLKNVSYLLFDLRQDPGEEVNMASQYPQILEDMIYKLKLYQQSYVEPQPNDGSDCPWTGFVNHSIVGPTWYVSEESGR